MLYYLHIHYLTDLMTHTLKKEGVEFVAILDVLRVIE